MNGLRRCWEIKILQRCWFVRSWRELTRRQVFSGDEDNGEMGAWYVLSALGLFAAAVGTTEDYVLGAVPLFPQCFV